MFKLRDGTGVRFAELLDRVSDIAPDVRFRFTSPHPKDFPDPLLDVIASKANVCKHIHIPAQSGNTDMLFRMRRNHTRESYLELIDNIRAKIPGVALSSDFICGFCEETEAEFEDTISLIEIVQYDLAFLFHYSMREKTHAHRRL
jgi:tRNA A37 methylthiotransferase MiaB